MFVVSAQATSTVVKESVENGESSSGFPLKPWQIALAVGTPVAIGATVYYMYIRRKKSSKPPKSSEESRRKEPVGRPGLPVKPVGKQSSIELSKWQQAKQDGNNLFKVKNFREAIECYTRAIDLCPSEKKDELSTFYQNRAAAHEMLKEYKEVIRDCTEAINCNQKYSKALHRRAKAYETLGQTTPALNDITAVCILEQFENQSNLLMTDRLLRIISKDKAKTHVRSRVPSMPSSQFIKHYFMSYSRDPIIIDAESVNELQVQNILDDLISKSQDATNDPKVNLLKGTMEILKGNIEDAEKLLEKVIESQEADAETKVNALVKLGTIRVHDVDGDNDNIKNALSCFDNAIKIDAGNADVYIHRAQIYLLTERVEEAKKDLETCVTLNPSFASAVAQKLYVDFRFAFRSGYDYSLDVAMKGFEDAILNFPNSTEVVSLYAQSLMEKSEFERADEYFKRAIEIDPNDANLYVHRGILILQSLNDVSGAIKLLEKALKVDPKCQFAYEMLGSLEVQRGDLRKGIKCFEKALSCAQTELDCAHLFSLRDAAEAQLRAANILGIEIPK